jgi:hypothetical protein
MSEKPKYDVPPHVEKDLRERFGPWPKGECQEQRSDFLRDHFYELAVFVAMNTKPGREQALALTRMEEAFGWANAAIARERPSINGPPPKAA